jgi:hypothetical protein
MHVCHPIVEQGGAFVQSCRRLVDRPVTVTDGRPLAFEPGHLAFLCGLVSLTNGSWPSVALGRRRHAQMGQHELSVRPVPSGKSGADSLCFAPVRSSITGAGTPPASGLSLPGGRCWSLLVQ